MTGTESTTLRPIPEFEGVHDIWPRGKRLEAIREAATNYRERFLRQGQVRAITSFDTPILSKTPSIGPSPRNPQWRRFILSSECAHRKRKWPVVPTFSQGGLDYGAITVPAR